MGILTDQRWFNVATFFPVSVEAKYKTVWLPLPLQVTAWQVSAIPFPSMTYIVMHPQGTLGSRTYLCRLSVMVAAPSFPACQSKNVKNCWSPSAFVRCLLVTFSTHLLTPTAVSVQSFQVKHTFKNACVSLAFFL